MKSSWLYFRVNSSLLESSSTYVESSVQSTNSHRTARPVCLMLLLKQKSSESPSSVKARARSPHPKCSGNCSDSWNAKWLTGGENVNILRRSCKFAIYIAISQEIWVFLHFRELIWFFLSILWVPIYLRLSGRCKILRVLMTLQQAKFALEIFWMLNGSFFQC